MMNFSGIQRTSTLDYPHKLSTVLFTQGCNFRCPYCHNKELVEITSTDNITISQQEALEFLDKRKKLVEAVVISGGEPTLHQSLPEFIKQLKAKGYLVKLDTNGTNPKMIKDLLPHLDFIAMDMKNSIKEYKSTAGKEINEGNIKESIQLIMNSTTDYEFRTTLVPKYHSNENLIELANNIKGAKKLSLQQLNRENTLDSTLINEKIFDPDEIYQIKRLLKDFVEEIEIRGV